MLLSQVRAPDPAWHWWSPADLPDLWGWWDADAASTFHYSSGTTVSEWRDKSGNARHLAGSAERNATINGRTALAFNGTSHFLERDPVPAPPLGSTLLAVARNTETGAVQRNALMIGAPNGDGRIFRTSGGAMALYQGAFLTTSAWGTVTRSIVGVFDHTSSSITVDSGTPVGGNAGSAPFGTRLRVGAFAGGSDTELWKGEIAELAVITSVITTTDRDAWFSYTAAKWGST